MCIKINSGPFILIPNFLGHSLHDHPPHLHFHSFSHLHLLAGQQANQCPKFGVIVPYKKFTVFKLYLAVLPAYRHIF